jgi:DNA-binding protein H-NS
MKYDLKSMTRKELEKLGANVDKALEKLAGHEKKAALAAAEKAAKAHGFSLAEITGGKPVEKTTRKVAKGPKAKSVPKYANPADKTQTWTGKGRQPDWFKAALAAGTTPDDLVI